MRIAGEIPATRYLRLVKGKTVVLLSIVDGDKIQTLVFDKSAYLAALSFANQVAETGELVLDVVHRDH